MSPACMIFVDLAGWLGKLQEIKVFLLLFLQKKKILSV
jgi:hypothetical protein